jgi:protein-disulfide isomerase-like protein with CxxC motif
MRQSHTTQHVWRLGELDVVVTDDLYAVAPGIEEIEKLTGQHFHARLRQGMSHGLLVIDNEPKMTTVISGLGATLLEGQELIAQVDEGRGFASAAKLELEQATIKRQRVIDITDFESDMVETDGRAFFAWAIRILRSLAPPLIWWRDRSRPITANELFAAVPELMKKWANRIRRMELKPTDLILRSEA